MARTFRRSLLVLVLALAALPATASAAEPPWCGTPEPDFSSDVLADGTDPADPVGSFPHIPHYAIGCTLEDIQDRSRGRMKVEVIGKSALGRAHVRRRHQPAAQLATRSAPTSTGSPSGRSCSRARSWPRSCCGRMDDDVKVPILVQGGIHGNEYEGVDSVMDVIEKYATTPYGEDPTVDEILSNSILVFNVIQNPDGRVNGVRENAQRVRPQPRLHDAVAARDDRLDQR